ncbi:antA/AntB antirepressor family protein [Roseospira goensis]|uniref:Phage anti-repressor protein n=1 Tax=Roseospira goensis TaxID=391922 RepID=A0A7W6S317_9PROT|nr:phage anti-repressor protein [Roseospira goensis]
MIGGRTVLGVADARDLHAGLGVGRDYTNWIKGRIAKYGFREGVDFEIVEDLSSPDLASAKARPQKVQVYRLTLDMSKQLAMVENNETGRLIRRYFLWCEEQAQRANAELTRRMDGMLRMISHKVAGTEKMMRLMADAMERQDADLVAMAERVNHLMLAADGRVAALEYVSVRGLLDEAQAITKGRNGLNRKIGRDLRTRALLSPDSVAVRKCPHSGVWLFPRDFAARYMEERGKALVAEHNDRQRGQGVLTFPRRAGRKPDPATTDVPASPAE